MTSVGLSTACARDPDPVALEHLPDSVFEPPAEYEGPLETLGDLADGYVTNTTALRQAINKLRTLCQAASRCEGPDGA